MTCRKLKVSLLTGHFPMVEPVACYVSTFGASWMRVDCPAKCMPGSLVRFVFAVYLGRMVTVNELLAVFVSVPPNVAEPVVEKVPAVVGTKFTVTIRVWPPGRLGRLQVSVPPSSP